jgi:signal transduction histidine kinase
MLGLLLEQTDALRLDDIQSHPRFAGFPANHPSMRSFLGVPIRRGDSVLGSLYLADKLNGESFTEEDEIAVEALGAHAAIAIYNLQMLSRQRALIRGLIAAQEDERRAIAYDLHDGLTQYVMASHAHLESFRRAQAKGDDVRADREMDQGLSFLKEAVVESRRLVNGLRALVLDDLGLAGALEQLLNEEKLRSNWVDAQIVHNVAGRRFDKTVETAVYRIAQEALTNARKHACADRIRLMMLLAGESATGIGQLTLEIRDWGKGFDPAERARDQVHVGLHSMGERAQLLGGTYTLDSAPGQGTIVRAVLPALPYEEEQDE